MIVQCPACNSRYRIREANIPASGGKIRCPSCAHSFVVYPESKADEDEDRTSITNPNALNQLVSKMATKPPLHDENSTAIVSRGDVDSLRAFQQMAQDLGDADDGTLEIKNPMEIWKSAQSAIENARAAAAAANAGNDEESEADEYDAAPTEIVSGGNLPKLPFPSAKPKLPSSGPPIPATIPTPAVAAPPSIPTPAAPARPVPPVPALPPLPAAPPIPEPVRAGASANFPTAGASGNFPTADRAPQAPAFPPPKPDPFQEDGLSTQQLANPFTGANALNPFATPGQNQTPAPGFANPYGEPAPAAPANPFGAPQAASNASADILAAIEESTSAHAQPESPKPDANHQGPWKLKTDFGLTYEFPDVKSLRNWLSSRDETDGFKLSADGVNFFAIRDFPQFERRVGMSQIGLPQPQNLGPLPGQFPGNTPETPGGMPAFAQPGFTPPPSASQSGSFSGPVIPGQYASYHGGPLPAAPAGPPVMNEYRPPSRSASDNKLLWGIFAVLLVVAVLVGLQTTGIVDLLGMAGFGKKPVEVAPITDVKPVENIDNIVEENVDAEVEALLKEVRRDLKNKKIQSALDRLTTIEALAPKRAEVFELRAQGYDLLGETEKAQAERDKAKQLEATAEPQPAATPDAGNSPDAAAENN